MKSRVNLTSFSSDETKKIGQLIGQYTRINTLILLHGDLGAGKTCLTKGIAVGCGITQMVNSPTFNICKIYYGDKKLVHIDAYRLEGIDMDYGFEEEFDDAITVVEWSEFVNYHSLHQIHINIDVNEDFSRNITFEFEDDYNQDLIGVLQK